MSTVLDAAQIAKINGYDADKRFEYFLSEVRAHQQIWLLVDEHGCVMLNTEDEDCVPVWPHKEFAEAWATGEWAQCKIEAISLAKWRSRWTSGLRADELAVAVFPDQYGEGIVISPDELDAELSRKVNKR